MESAISGLKNAIKTNFAQLCSQGCMETQAGPKCFCKPGFSLAGDGYGCTDANANRVSGHRDDCDCAPNNNSFTVTAGPLCSLVLFAGLLCRGFFRQG
jgi:hypothetical protein